MLVSDFDYKLPDELIAQEPLPDRAASRMLHLARDSGHIEDLTFRNFPDLLHCGDVLVLNNTRVFPARLYGRRAGKRAQPVSPRNPAARDFLHGKVEVLLTRQRSLHPNVWECLVHPGRKIGIGERLFFGGSSEQLEAEVVGRGSFGERTIQFSPTADFFAAVGRFGHTPLPPYIDRPDQPGDRERYQTIYAQQPGSVAAPTAGLHFTPQILGRIRESGVETAEITLHVGLGTFQPVHAERVEDHKMHHEWYSIPPVTAERINKALSEHRRVIAVGTTVVRTLESVANQYAGKLQPGSGECDLFMYPGYPFRVVGALLTNFHLPRSTLLMLVCAFAGRERVLSAYQHAVEERYRFYSYGDCMFIE